MNTTSEKSKISFLKKKALALRIDSIRATTAARSGHPTSCLSAADLISALYFSVIKFDKQNPKNLDNDHFILSKGHAVPIVYAALKQLEIISDEKLLSLRSFSSILEGHPTPRFIYNTAATGSLGQGLSIGVGMALSLLKDKLSSRVFVMMGDSEISEGSVWEGLALATHYKLHNLIGILDCNRLGQTGESLNNHNVEIYEKKISAFGWKTIVIDGHDMQAIIAALDEARQPRETPCMIIAKTYKGYGLDELSNNHGFHGKPLNEAKAHAAIAELHKKFDEESNYNDAPKSPQFNATHAIVTQKNYISFQLEDDPHFSKFRTGEKLATRKAYGYGLLAAGRLFPQAVVLDAEVKNSTFSEWFDKEFPERFVQCFVAEQAMISIATGFSLCGKIPFASTFGAFLSRAFDQIRMAGIGRNALRLCGSHSGVSIGEDGPSQMALEDIAMLRAVPNSIILYPSDAVSAYKCVELSANYHDGVSYIRTTREDTPILYDYTTSFKIGGSHILHSSPLDKVCLISAGITAHEALKAYTTLLHENIHVSVIDLYSIKPIDAQTIIKIGTQSHNKIIVIEDHYEAGGIGEAVRGVCENSTLEIHSLCVRKLPRSGKPHELLHYEEIDEAAIIKKVKEIL